MHSLGWNLTQRELKYIILAIRGKFVYLGKCGALRMCYAKNPVKDFDWFWQANFWWWENIILLNLYHENVTKNINSQVLVPLTDNNESTVPKFSHWQLQKVSKPLINYNGFSDKFEAWLNLKFAWYHSMKLFTAIGWKDLKFFCRTLMGITCFDIIINLDSCFGL